MLEHNLQKCFYQFFGHDLARDSLRDLDYSGEVELIDPRFNLPRRTGRGPFGPEVWVHLVELPHFSIGSPAQIAVAGVLQMGMGIGLEATRRVEAPDHFVAERLVVDQAVVAGRADGLLVETLGLELPPVKAGDLRADQRGAAHKVFRAVFGPLLELAVVGGHALLVLGALGIRRRLAERDQRQRSVQVVVGPLKDDWRHPEEAFCLGGCGDGGDAVVGEDARLQLANPVHEGGYSKTRLSRELLLELLLLEAVVVEAAEDGRQTPKRPDQSKLRGDQTDDDTETGPARKVEPGLGLLMHLREGGTAREKLREEVVAADPCIGKVADLLRGFEGISRERATRASMPHRRFREIAEGQIDPGLQALHSRLLDKVQPELAKAESLLVIPEVKPEHVPHSRVSVARSVAVAMLNASSSPAHWRRQKRALPSWQTAPPSPLSSQRSPAFGLTSS